MILKKIKLNPFGGLTLKEMDFTEGINVIVGPNEAGKTTIFHALERSLFTRTDFPPARFQNEMGCFLPVGGGDTIRVELQLMEGNKLYVLQRSWGKARGSTLTLPDASIISDEEEISKKLKSLLGAGEGTYRSILLTYQTGLTTTLQQLKEKYPETLQSLGDLLRKSVLETDGVSVDRFKELIDHSYDDHFNHWDAEANLPEKGRGIQNPYTKKVGFILAAYYEKEKAKLRLKEALDYEKQMDELTKKLGEVTAELEEKVAYLEKHRDAYEAASKRQLIMARLEATRASMSAMIEANKKWPVLEASIFEIEKKLPEIEKLEKELTAESEEARKEEENRGIREKYGRVLEIKKLLEDAETKLSKVKKITGDELEKIEKAMKEVELLETRQLAGRLTMEIYAKTDLIISVETDAERSEKREFRGRESETLEARRSFRVEHSDWVIEVKSGKEEGRVEGEKNLKEAEDHLKRLCDELGIKNHAEAKELNRIYEEKLSNVTNLRGQMTQELGDITLEELESKMKEIGPEKITRKPFDIITELSNVRKELDQMRSKLKDSQKQLEQYKKIYGSQEKLLLKAGEAVKTEKEHKEELDRLPPLPEGFENAESFIEKYKKTSEEKDKLKDEQNDLKLQIARLEGEAPEESPEELKGIVSEADERFKDTLKKGNAIAKIRGVAYNIISEIDRSTYHELEQKLSQYISILTGKRYQRLDMERGIPRGFIRGDGVLLPVELLSTGTLDVLALSIRFAMAGYFLENKRGFMVMDDPLVNLDPERQRLASKIISSFASEHQILLFTCHPLHAELIGGNIIEI
ncbi:MAG: AAA family ATPase [Spirochaetota bacterium]